MAPNEETATAAKTATGRKLPSRRTVTLAVVAVAALVLAMTPLGDTAIDRASRGLDLVWNNLITLAVGAALIALASTPIAFAVLGRLDYFETRRGRTLQKPTFSSVVASMALIMGIPAIFGALVVKSESFDQNRYAFDPNRTVSVLDQGRGFASVREADEAVRREMDRLSNERKNLVNSVRKLDEALIGLQAATLGTPLAGQAVKPVLDRMGPVRQSVGLDAPQQLLTLTGTPVEVRNAQGTVIASVPPAAVAQPIPTAPAPAPPVTSGNGLSQAQFRAELADVPAPQKTLAALLPLDDVPVGWTAGTSGNKHLETFNAENLYEKINGRAESFIQYDVKGMAYAFFNPTDDASNEVQLYVFEMGNSLKALGKYGSEKPGDVTTIPIGSEGYESAGSTLFYSGPYYIQIVSTTDSPKFAEFAREIAKKVEGRIKGGSTATAAATPGTTPAHAPAANSPATVPATPEGIFALLPSEPKKNRTQFVAQDVFGYSFFTDVFLADYQDGDASWQGFLRPYPDAKAARAVFDKYIEGAKADGATLKMVETEGADTMVVSSNIGLVDAVFLKGNTIGGANGGTEAVKAEEFARKLVKTLPATVPNLSGAAPDAPSEGPASEEKAQ